MSFEIMTPESIKAKTVEEFEADYDVLLISKADSKLMSFIGWIYPAWFHYWTTYRLPFQRKVRITYPPYLAKHVFEMHKPTLYHELHHVKQFAPWWGPWVCLPAVTLLPLPIIFSGRWFIERHAYLDDILTGRRTVEEAVHTLWYEYLQPWPPPLMRRWFQKKLSGSAESEG